MSVVVKAKKEPALYLTSRQECHAQDAGRRSMMPMLALLDTSKKGRQAEELENKLHHLVIGQEEAIHQIVRAYQTHLAGLTPVGRPIGNFLFLGPTGSGKNPYRGGDRRIPAEEFSSRNQDRLCGVSTQP